MNFKNILSVFLLSLISSTTNAQILNDRINYEVFVDQYYSSADNDNTTQDDISALTSFYSYDIGDWSDEYCHYWQCNAPCYDQTVKFMGGVENAPFDDHLTFLLQGWENDSGSNCTYDSGDDFLSNGTASNLGNQYVTSNRLTTEFYSNYGANNSSWVYSNSAYHNMVIKTVWRYTHGDNYLDPLEFGYINLGTTESNVNSNRGFVSGSNVSIPVGYTNGHSEQGSFDVYYEFIITETAEVVISTDHPETNYDSYLYLYNHNYSIQIDTDDDGGSGNKAEIVRTLCPGTYRVVVEGYGTSVGHFKLSISTSSPEPFAITGATVTNPTCPDSNNGSIDIYGTNGDVDVSSINWSNGSTNWYSGSLSAGNHTVTVTDECGQTYTETYTLTSNDTQSPTILCTPVLVEIGSAGFVDVNASAFDNGSYDNCGITNMSVTPSHFTWADEGFVDVEFSVSDASGNTDYCITYVEVVNLTATEDVELQAGLSIFPNPNSGVFQVALTGEVFREDVQMRITNMVGRELLKHQVTEGTRSIDLSEFPKGIYLLSLQKENAVVTQKIIVQ